MTLPNFLVIGPGRSGTTSLYFWLGEHREIYMSPYKEVCYYAVETENRANAILTREAYEQQFDGVAGEKRYGEACPAYFWSRTACDRIAADIPDALLIASLRNPAERAYSGWLRSVEKRGMIASASDALQPGQHHYEIGFYSKYLRRLYARFPRENVKVIIFDDLVKRPDDVMRDLFTFLGVDPDVKVRTDIRHNKSKAPYSRRLNRLYHKAAKLGGRLLPRRFHTGSVYNALHAPMLRNADPMSPELRRRLLTAYHDDILETGKILGRDLTHWLE